jgi:hypothetical protein
VKDICGDFLKDIGPYSRIFTDFAELQKEMKEVTSGPEIARTKVCVVGNTGIGKSTFINANLCRVRLATASDASKACTKYPITYEYLPGAADNTKHSNFIVEISNHHARLKLTRDHITTYCRVYIAPYEVELSNEHPETSVTEMDRKLAEEAKRFLRLIWDVENDTDAENDLQMLLSASSVDEDSLIQRCMAIQDARLRKLNVDGNFIVLKNIPDTMESGHAQGSLDITTAHEIVSKIWPLVLKVTIRTGGVLLRNGIVITDLPGKCEVIKSYNETLTFKGYGDLNQQRIATANEFRREADVFELIIGEGLRLETEAVYTQIRQSIRVHSIDHTILVVNKMDVSDITIMYIDYRKLLTDYHSNTFRSSRKI